MSTAVLAFTEDKKAAFKRILDKLGMAPQAVENVYNEMAGIMREWRPPASLLTAQFSSVADLEQAEEAISLSFTKEQKAKLRSALTLGVFGGLLLTFSIVTAQVIGVLLLIAAGMLLASVVLQWIDQLAEQLSSFSFW